MGLIGGIAKTALAAGTWAAVSNTVSRRQAGRWADENQSSHSQGYMPPPPGRYQRPMFQQHRPTSQPAPPQPAQQPVQAPAPLPTTTDVMNARLAQLQQLGTLKAQGILNQTEFENEKRKILG